MAVDEGAVLRPQILDDGGGALDRDHRVAAADLGLVDADIGIFGAADDGSALHQGSGSVVGVELERHRCSPRRRRRLGHRNHGRYQSVAAPGDVLDVGGLSCVVTEGGAELGDDLGERVVADELGSPDLVDDVAHADQLARGEGEGGKHIHGPGAQPELATVA